MNRNLVGSTYGRLCIKFPQSIVKGEPTEPLAFLIEEHFPHLPIPVKLFLFGDKFHIVIMYLIPNINTFFF